MLDISFVTGKREEYAIMNSATYQPNLRLPAPRTKVYRLLQLNEGRVLISSLHFHSVGWQAVPATR